VNTNSYSHIKVVLSEKIFKIHRYSYVSVHNTLTNLFDNCLVPTAELICDNYTTNQGNPRAQNY
jgi:hypothetical protein